MHDYEYFMTYDPNIDQRILMAKCKKCNKNKIKKVFYEYK